MTAIAPPKPDSIFTTPEGNRQWCRDWECAIDTAERTPRVRWIWHLVRAITATPEISTVENDWIEMTLPLLRRVGEMGDNWDGEGSPRPDPEIIAAAKRLLRVLQGSRHGAVPVPFVSPIGGGGLQLEWTSSDKHLEIEFLDASTIAFLRETMTPGQESMVSGEYRLEDVDATRRLLDWFAAI